MRIAIALAVTLVILGAAAWLALSAWQQYWDEPLALNDTPVTYEIESGASLGEVALELAAQGWLRRPQWFVWHARSRGDAGRIRAGEYRIEPGMTPAQLLELFISGEVAQHAFTIIEGSSFADVRLALSRLATVAQNLPELTDAQVMQQLGRPGVHPEGQFLPETYYYTKGTSDLKLLARAMSLKDTALETQWQQRTTGDTLQSPYEALILASIIEKETGLESERPDIAGVFIRRLRKGMRLQSDPTVIYGLGDAYDGNIRRRDLQTDTPYNTYTRSGLPPTPIAMPGRASIAAAVKPAAGETLFFVATGNGDGSHYFSVTLEEHNRAVQRYLARLRKRP